MSNSVQNCHSVSDPIFGDARQRLSETPPFNRRPRALLSDPVTFVTLTQSYFAQSYFEAGFKKIEFRSTLNRHYAKSTKDAGSPMKALGYNGS